MIITPETKKECCDESRLTRYIRKIHSQSINSLKDEIINLKDKVIKKLQDESKMWKTKRVAILESNHNDLAQYGRRNNIVFSSIPDNVPDNNL